MDATGELVWMRPGTGSFATDLRVATYQGAPVLTWWEGANNSGIGSGEHVVMDATYREVLRIPSGSDRKADLHELRLTGRGTALFFADAEMGPGPMAGSAQPVPRVMDCAIQEVDVVTGAMRFERHAVDHIDVDESVVAPPTGGYRGVDDVHANSIEEDADGNLIVSARNTRPWYKVHRATGRIMWRLGGKRSDFATGPRCVVRAPARRPPPGGRDADTVRRRPGARVSRGIVLTLDEVAMTATLVCEYRQPQDLLATSQGNVQVLPGGNVFIGWGSVPRFSEFTADGRLLLDAGFTATQSYRDCRFPWDGRPAQPPAIAVDAGGGGLVVYASWNGATDVAHWEVLAGPAGGSMRVIAASPRTGFETLIAVPALMARWPSGPLTRPARCSASRARSRCPTRSKGAARPGPGSRLPVGRRVSRLWSITGRTAPG